MAPSHFTSPRRTCSGLDYNRMLMILAVLEKRVGMTLGNKDVYVNVVGGVRIDEPATDLAVALAVVSSLLDISADETAVALGEIGLAGEVRSVSHTEKRLKEAARLGFEKAIVASQTAKKLSGDIKLDAIGASSVRSAIDAAFSNVRETNKKASEE